MKNKTEKTKEQSPPRECEICLEPSKHLILNEETKEWMCLSCKKELSDELSVYEDHFSYSHHYYMDRLNEDQDL